ncbi:glycoside hydrolase [Aureobasidium pullulans]|uniref:chitinase n=1 Tax=Aureobasidium pullulans TaxID=5580 RepID=A0A4T0E858_AURPU|nr:glycoside hydrolase [Aureobasidium pullulans]
MRHEIDRRDATTTSLQSIPTSTPDTEAAELMETVTSIQEGLSDLPQDVFEFLKAINDRLHEQEALLSSLLAVFTSASGVASSTVTVDNATSSSVPVFWSTATETSSNVVTEPSATACRRGGAAIYSSDIDSPSTNATITSADSQALATPNSIPKPTSTSYTFKPTRKNNVAVYYGQTPTTQTGDLLALCQNSNVDIVVLAFVTSFFTNGGFPSANFGPSCKGSTRAQQLHAPGLQDCTDLAPEITACQQLGKPVLVSLGGYYSNVTFTSDTEAIQLAQNLWDLFGAGDGLDPSLRPFGSIVIDGFDLDNESKDSTSYTTFAHALRALSNSDRSKTYYLSAAPQCPRPDTSLPLSTLALCDFVFVQFYNNPSCDLSSSGFASSFAAWSDDLTAANNETRLFIGAAATEAAGSGYVEGAGLGHQVSLARQLYVGNLGGVMLWDGKEAVGNVDGYGNDYLVYAKGSLQ